MTFHASIALALCPWRAAMPKVFDSESMLHQRYFALPCLCSLFSQASILTAPAWTSPLSQWILGAKGDACKVTMKESCQWTWEMMLHKELSKKPLWVIFTYWYLNWLLLCNRKSLNMARQAYSLDVYQRFLKCCKSCKVASGMFLWALYSLGLVGYIGNDLRYWLSLCVGFWSRLCKTMPCLALNAPFLLPAICRAQFKTSDLKMMLASRSPLRVWITG